MTVAACTACASVDSHHSTAHSLISHPPSAGRENSRRLLLTRPGCGSDALIQPSATIRTPCPRHLSPSPPLPGHVTDQTTLLLRPSHICSNGLSDPRPAPSSISVTFRFAYPTSSATPSFHLAFVFVTHVIPPAIEK